MRDVISQSQSEDRRKEARLPTNGKIALWLDWPGTAQIAAQLVDASASGFRATFNHPSLELNAEVGFSRGRWRGKARIMWKRIEGSRVEAGFFILPHD